MIYDYNSLFEAVNKNKYDDDSSSSDTPSMFNRKKNKTTPEATIKRQENIKKAIAARKEKYNMKKEHQLKEFDVLTDDDKHTIKKNNVVKSIEVKTEIKPVVPIKNNEPIYASRSRR